MDFATHMSGTDPTHPHRTSSQEPHPPAPHQRRHNRYTSPESSTPPPPPHALLDTLRHQSAMSRRAQAARNASPPPQAPPGPAIASSSQLPEVLEISDLNNGSVTQGQDHDRMETDEGSDESDSESEAETPEPNDHPSSEETPIPQIQATHGNEAMDTTPDDSVAENPAIVAPNLQNNPTSIGTVRIGVNAATGALEATMPLQPSQVIDAGSNTMDSEQIQAAIQNAAMENAEVREELAEARRRQQRQADRSQDQDEGEGGEEDSDDSADEEEHPYWANFKEDTSSPDEAELAVIGDQMEEASALDHEYWEKTIFESLSDPDYVPGDSARISWTVKGVHGTPESPNREKIMRSPSICVGGLHWNIKYYPRGNDGTEQLSIYLECSPTPHDVTELEEIETIEEEENGGTDAAIVSANVEGAVVDSSSSGAADLSSNANGHGPVAPNQSEEPVQSSQTLPDAIPEIEAPWRIAAQVGCVIYNPDEPRVYASQKSCHRYYNDNPDWGWTRFHGPWDELHKRKRYQRQALLRNDTLSFTAYIRIINDDTNSLWWHPPKDKPQWNSLEMTGMRAFDCQEYGSSAMVAAISTWLHLGLIAENIKKCPIPNEIWEPEKRMRPALQELQDILYERNNHSSIENDLRLAPLGAILSFYGVRIHSKMDVIMLWENIRRILSFEAAAPNTNSVEEANNQKDDLFEQVLLLKQPEPVDEKAATFISNSHEPRSVQEALDMSPQSYRSWESFPGQHQLTKADPAILQLELHRQSYHKETRKWKKLTHQITLDENVQFHGLQYTLYGFIVHTGDLECREYYSVIRPSGPKTQWFKFAGDTSRKGVTILTSNEAIKAHEGGENVSAGDSAVAYIVSYIRTDQLPAVLSAKPDRKSIAPSKAIKATASTVEAPSSPDLDAKYAPVYFYGVDTFKNCTGRGFFDPWSQQVSNSSDSVMQLRLPLSTTVRQIRDLLQSQALQDDEKARVKIWVLNTTAPAVRAYPGFLRSKDWADDTLVDVSLRGGCRFWLDVRNGCDIRQLMQRLQALNVADLSRLLLNVAELSRLLDANPPTGPTTDSKHLQHGTSSATDGDNTDTVMADTQDVAAEIVNTAVEEPQSHASLSHAADQPHEQTNDEAHAQNQVQNADRSQNQDTNEDNTGTDPASSEVLYFIKIFDAEAQNLRGVGSYIANCATKITQQARISLGIGTNEAWDFYHEHSLTLKPRDLIKANSTFLDPCYGEGAFDDNIIVAQRRPTTAQ